MTVDAYPKTITVTPQSKAGSKVGTISFFINETQANNTMIFFFYISNSYFTIHNNSGEQIEHSHDIHPTFYLLVSKTNNTVPYFSPFSFRDLASAKCVYNSTTYFIVPFDIVLSSDSLYHLGDHVVYLEAFGHNDFQWFHFNAKISLRVQAGMDMFMGTCMHAC